VPPGNILGGNTVEFALPPLQVAVKVLDKILTHPESHDQAVWTNVWHVFGKVRIDVDTVIHTCGTRACIAGWAVIFALPPEYLVSTYAVYSSSNRHVDDISDVAQEALGMTYAQARWLFSSHRTYDEVTYHLRKFIGKGNWSKIPVDGE
jgi:hypothetical protein